MVDQSKYFITAALPYANGAAHFGHLAGVYIPADIYYRHCKFMGRDAVYICGTDEHGVAIMFGAEKEGLSCQEYVDKYYDLWKNIFDDYDIEFTYFGRTTSARHKENSQAFFTELKEKNVIEQASTKNPYCNSCDKYIPDRYLGGTCIHCGFKDARGDECPNCGKWLSFEELKDPYCQICKKNEIELKENQQWYLDLSKFETKLKDWINSHSHWKKNIQNYVTSLIDAGLPKRAISRNIEWGIDVPADTEGRKLYVWFEAPIGYLTNLQEFFDVKGNSDGWKPYWSKESKMIHFIGKDNIIFHTIMWPAMLMNIDGAILPENVPANMYVQLQGKQFSKSSGWYVDATDALNEFGSDRMRYYLTTIIPETDDTSFDWKSFQAKVNGELIDNIANYCNRILALVNKNSITPDFNGELCLNACIEINASAATITSFIDGYEFKKALNAVMKFGKLANNFCNDHAPWKLVKEDPAKAKVVLSAGILYIAAIGSFLAPFLPRYSDTLKSIFQGLDFEKVYRGECSADLFNDSVTLDMTVLVAIQKISDDEIKVHLDELSRISV